mmetsp:Transcript_11805/g.17596  ORF Transcript_11805/g.17596 Transcript_11805/m.17596 type:complete len:284 (+) Transcript_11805:143-994(+)
MDSITGNIQQDCIQHFWRKTLIFFLVFLVSWNATKIPYYIQFDYDGDSDYEKGGLAGSINLAYWIDGFESSKLHSPACNFLLVHIAFGSTVLIMMALTMIKTSWRRKYGNYFFTFAILLGVHTLPAAWTMGYSPDGPSTKPFLKYLFTFTCVWCIVAALFGYRTLKNYDKDPAAAEKALAIEYGLITLGAYGAGFAEFTGIASKFMYKMEHGVFKTYPELDPLFGHSFYDIIPEKYGMTIFFAWVAIIWFWWPIKLLQPDLNVGEGKTKETEPLNATYGSILG